MGFHRILRELGQQNGYDLDNEGVCAGYLTKTIEAFFCGDEEFTAYMKRMRRIETDKDLAAKMRQAVNNPASLSTSDYQSLVDIRAFFDGLSIYQKPESEKVVALFGNKYYNQADVGSLSSFASPKMIEDRGGLSIADHWTGIYSNGELQEYLRMLEVTAKNAQHRLAFRFLSGGHYTGLCYDPKKKTWWFVDVSVFPPFQISSLSDPKFVDYFKKTLTYSSSDKFVPFTTELLSVGNQKKELLALFDESIVKTMGLKLNLENGQYRTENGTTLAMIAARHGYADVIAGLNRAWILPNEINQPTNKGKTPVSIAAENGHANVITALKKAGITHEQLCEYNEHGATPTCTAAFYGHANVIKALWNAGVTPSELAQPARDGTTPIFIAAENGHADVITMLKRVNVEHKKFCEPNNHGATPAFIAALNGHANVIIALSKAGLTPLELSKPASDGTTPIFIAASNGHAHVITTLINLGISQQQLNERNIHGATPAFIAALHGHVSVIEVLLKAGVAPSELNQPAKDGNTPAYLAVSRGHKHVIKLLCDVGAIRLDDRLSTNETVREQLVECANLHGHPQLAQFLRTYHPFTPAPVAATSQSATVSLAPSTIAPSATLFPKPHKIQMETHVKTKAKAVNDPSQDEQRPLLQSNNRHGHGTVT